MQLVKYSPKFNELIVKDYEAVYLLTGYIRKNNNCNYQIPYCVISKIFSFWNCIQITKLIKLLSKKNQDLCQLTTSYSLQNVQYKFILFVDSLFSLQIYPYSGNYEFSDFVNKNVIEMKLIKTSFGTCWKAFRFVKNIDFRIDVMKQECCERKFNYNLKISLLGGGLFEGKINIKLKSTPDQEPELEILLWEETDIVQGFTIYKEQSSRSKKTKSMIVIND